MEEADTELSRLAQSQSYFGLLLRLIVVAVVSIVVVRWWRRGGGVHVRIGHLNRACVTRRSVHILLRNLTSKYEQQQDDTTIDCSNSNSLYRGTIREITPLFTDLSQPKCETKICKTQECKHQQKRANSWTVAPKRLKWIRWVLLLNMYHYQRNKMPTACAVLYSRWIETSKSCCFWGRGGEESSTSELLWRMRVSGASSASLLLWRKARRSRTTRCNHSLLRIQRCSWNPRPSASPTNDPGAGCKMCKILAHFSAWYHGKVAPGHHGIFPIWRLIELPPFSVLFDSVRI